MLSIAAQGQAIAPSTKVFCVEAAQATFITSGCFAEMSSKAR
jgi:hypothetical protein